jgi:hypothetical protein
MRITTRVWFLLTPLSVAAAFAPTTTTRPRAATTRTHLAVLTERQVQFWEDVQEGLQDIEEFYQKSNLGLERLWDFCASAQGKVAPPVPVDPGHEPSEEHVAGLTARPFWNVTAAPDLFPWAQELEAKAHVIQEEFEEKLLGTSRFASDSVWQNQVMGEGWSAIRLQRLGVWQMENCQVFPKTYELLRDLKIPLAVRG